MHRRNRPVPGRHNMYHAIHKGLRLGHSRLLQQIGSTDFADDGEAAATVVAVRGFLALGRGHLDSEEAVIHPAIEARDLAATADAHAGHEDHENAFAEIEGLLVTIETTGGDVRVGAGQALYSRYARFVAADFLHMDEEEQDLLGAMHRLFTDDELRGIEGAVVGKIDPGRMMSYLTLIVPALNHPERVGMLSGIRAAMPPEAFAAVMEHAVRETLTPADAAAVEMALGLRRAA